MEDLKFRRRSVATHARARERFTVNRDTLGPRKLLILM
jgi:hypothetical protein